VLLAAFRNCFVMALQLSKCFKPTGIKREIASGFQQNQAN
jgi:hypothetical protein